MENNELNQQNQQNQQNQPNQPNQNPNILPNVPAETVVNPPINTSNYSQPTVSKNNNTKIIIFSVVGILLLATTLFAVTRFNKGGIFGLFGNKSKPNVSNEVKPTKSYDFDKTNLTKAEITGNTTFPIIKERYLHKASDAKFNTASINVYEFTPQQLVQNGVIDSTSEKLIPSAIELYFLSEPKFGLTEYQNEKYTNPSVSGSTKTEMVTVNNKQFQVNILTARTSSDSYVTLFIQWNSSITSDKSTVDHIIESFKVY